MHRGRGPGSILSRYYPSLTIDNTM